MAGVNAFYHQVFDLRMTDGKGRKIGAVASAYYVDANGYTNDRARAVQARVIVQATRNGDRFGASPDGKRVALDNEAIKAEVLRRLAGMAKRYAKIVNAGANGSIETKRDALTGCMREIRPADDTDSGKYEVVCWDHGTLVGVETLARARGCSTVDFCEQCMEKYEIDHGASKS